MNDTIQGVVERINFHNPENAWTVLKLKQENIFTSITVTVHQSNIFPGASIRFTGSWHIHAKHGKQFIATAAQELKPTDVNALEKYIGSGLIHGVGPSIAKRIVKHFKNETLDVFEYNLDKLIEVKGISAQKISKIQESWTKHRAIREVMMFLQSHDIYGSLAVKILSRYDDNSIYYVSKKPYSLAKDIPGVGFNTSDKIALSVGFKKNSKERISAAIYHCLSRSTEKGHCFLYLHQILASVKILLKENYDEQIPDLLLSMDKKKEIKIRVITDENNKEQYCYYNKTLFYDEKNIADRLHTIKQYPINYDTSSVDEFLSEFNQSEELPLSHEQSLSVKNIVNQKFSILTGGPGCGKTTTTKALVYVLLKLNRRIILAAPTGRAAQRMSEVIGLSAKTIHRLLVFNPQDGGFKKNQDDTLEGDILIIDEASMLDVRLTSSLLSAVSNNMQVLFIGDVDQLPSVGAGNLLTDIIESRIIKCFMLTKVFRQAKKSKIITYAHQMNIGNIPSIISPFNKPKIWTENEDCLFIDAEEASQEQLQFIKRSKIILEKAIEKNNKAYIARQDNKKGDYKYESLEKRNGVFHKNIITNEQANYIRDEDDALMFNIPHKFKHVNLENLLKSPKEINQLSSVLERIHPWSSINYGFSASDILVKMYVETIPKYLYQNIEIQILSPMTKGSLGTIMLNKRIQLAYNPPSSTKKEIIVSDKIFRIGDRVIQKKNNYELEIFNGDIGRIIDINTSNYSVVVVFGKKDDAKEIVLGKINLADLDLAYAITIHKSQGSEFDVVIIPLSSQHYNMLFRNLIYTAITRAKKMALFVGSRYALAQAIRNQDNSKRQTMLKQLLTI